MLGKVVKGRHKGCIVDVLPNKKTLYIQLENGGKVLLTRDNFISIDDISAEYQIVDKKVFMVMWNDFETSILLLVQRQGRSGDAAPKPVEAAPVDVRVEVIETAQMPIVQNTESVEVDPGVSSSVVEDVTKYEHHNEIVSNATVADMAIPATKATKETRHRIKEPEKSGKQSKKKTAIIAIAVAIVLCIVGLIAFAGGGFSKFGNSAAKQDAFLEDMSKGIKGRIANDKDTDSMSESEVAEYYAELVNYELAAISKYSDVTFADERFDILAHQYISACEIQLAATKNYRNTSLFSAMWNGGREIRSGIILYFYENYGLNLTEKEILSYLPSDSDHSISADSSGKTTNPNNAPEKELIIGEWVLLNIDGVALKFRFDGFSPVQDKGDQTVVFFLCAIENISHRDYDTYYLFHENITIINCDGFSVPHSSSGWHYKDYDCFTEMDRNEKKKIVQAYNFNADVSDLTFTIVTDDCVYIYTPSGGSASAGTEAEFIQIKDEVVEIVGICFSGDGYFTIDTYPDAYKNLNPATASILLADLQENALKGIRYANDALGFNGSVYNKMIETTALMGRQSEENNKYKVTWTYHPDDGLEVTYEVK